MVESKGVLVPKDIAEKPFVCVCLSVCSASNLVPATGYGYIKKAGEMEARVGIPPDSQIYSLSHCLTQPNKSIVLPTHKIFLPIYLWFFEIKLQARMLLWIAYLCDSNWINP